MGTLDFGAARISSYFDFFFLGSLMGLDRDLHVVLPLELATQHWPLTVHLPLIHVTVF